MWRGEGIQPLKSTVHLNQQGQEAIQKQRDETLRNLGVIYKHSEEPSPTPVYEGFGDVSRFQRKIDNAVAACHHFHTGSLMNDSFGNDHGARRQWQSDTRAELAALDPELADQFWAIRQRNKLRANSINIPYTFLINLAAQLNGVQTPQVARVHEIVGGLPRIREGVSDPKKQSPWARELMTRLNLPLPQGQILTLGTLYEVMTDEEKMKLVETMDAASAAFLDLVTEKQQVAG